MRDIPWRPAVRADRFGDDAGHVVPTARLQRARHETLGASGDVVLAVRCDPIVGHDVAHPIGTEEHPVPFANLEAGETEHRPRPCTARVTMFRYGWVRALSSVSEHLHERPRTSVSSWLNRYSRPSRNRYARESHAWTSPIRFRLESTAVKVVPKPRRAGCEARCVATASLPGPRHHAGGPPSPSPDRRDRCPRAAQDR